jgi:hypothetical protein
MKSLMRLVFVVLSALCVFSVSAEKMKLAWTASESDVLLWQSGFKGTGPQGPVLSFKILSPLSSPTPDFKIISTEYFDLKEIPDQLAPCDDAFLWGQRGVYKNYPYIELLVYPLLKGADDKTAKILTSFEMEFPGIPRFDPSYADYNDCPSISLNPLFLNYWDSCRFKEERILPEQSTVLNLPQATTPIYKISVNQDGTVRLTKDYLDSLGVNLSAVPPVNFHLTSRGVEIPIVIVDIDSDNVFDSGDSIVFYGQKLNIRNRAIWNGGDFTDTNVYFLYGNNTAGLRMQNVDVSSSHPAFPTTQTFIANSFFEENTFMPWGTHMRPNGELWFWPPFLAYYVGGGEKSRTVSINLPHPVSNSDSITIKVEEGGMNNASHILDASLNSGSYSSLLSFSGRTVAALTYSFVQSQLTPGGTNNLTLRIPSSQTEADNQILDSLTVSYLRTADIDNNTLLIEDQGGDKKYVAGTSSYKFSAVPYIFDISQKDASTGLYLPKNAVNAQYSSGIVTFDAAEQGIPRKFYMSSNTSLPLSIESISTRDLSAGCDLLIITHPDFHPGGTDAVWQSYLASKASRYSVLAVDAQEIYDSFSYGIFDPAAIRDFLVYAHNNWTNPPSYLLLIGDGSFDYKNYMNDSTFKSWVPTMVIEDTTDYIEQGWYASDSWLADLNSDGYPDMAVGRIPVRTYTALEGVLNKIMTYEAQTIPSPWYKTQFFVSDKNDGSLDFAGLNNTLKNTYAGSPYINLKVYYDDPPYNGTDQNACAAAIRDSWDDALLIHYAGHAGQWGTTAFWGYQNGIFSLSPLRSGQSDLDLLPVISPPSGRFPFVVNSTCYTAGFAYQAYPSLFESVLNASGKGAIGATGYTTLSYLSNQTEFADHFFEELYGLPKERIVGDAVENARFHLASSLTESRSLVLLGDPTLKLPLPTVPAPLNFTGTSGNQSASLSWSYPAPAPSSYDIYRSTDGGATFSIRGSGITASPYLDSGLTNNQTYIYYAVSKNSDGFTSAPSQLAPVIPLNPSAPAAPSGLKAADLGIGDTLRISWNANSESDLSYYTLYRGTSSGSYNYNQQLAKTATSLQMAGLTQGVTYFFALTATNTSNKVSFYSAEAAGTPTNSPVAVKVPAMITDLMVSRSGNDLILNWSKPLVDIKGNAVAVVSFDIFRVTGIYNYNLETVSTSSPNAKITVPAVDGVTAYNYTDAGAVNLAATVTYLVVARDAAGNRSPASHNAPASVLSLRVTKNSAVSPTLINFDPVTTRLDGTNTNLIAKYKLYGFYPMTSSKDHIAPASPLLSVDIDAAVPSSACDGGTAVYCDSSTSPPLLYTVIAVDNRGNTSLY